MWYEHAGRFGDRAAGDLTVDEDLTELRRRLAPLLPTLYTFLARRSQDPEEAEDLLVETLCRTKATTGQRTTADRDLLPWLLRIADKNLRARIEQHPLSDAGLAPNWVVPIARLPAGLLDGVGRLSWDDRQALGLRYGDGLPEEVVAQTLGADRGTGGALVERALASAHDAWARTLQEYVRSAGAPSVQVIRETLPALRAGVSLSRAQEERVWRRVGEEREDVFVPSQPLPVLPRWCGRALLPLASVLALTVAGLLWFGRGVASPEQEGRQPAVVPTAQGVRDAAAGSASAWWPPTTIGQVPNVSGGTPTRRSWEQSVQGRQGFRHGGTLYYLLAIPYGFQLAATSPDDSSQSGSLIAESYAEMTYAPSPIGGRVVIGDRQRLWLQDGGTTRELIRGHFSGHRGPDRPAWGGTGQLAWHPQGRMVAVTVYDDADINTPAPTSIQTVTTDTLERVALATLLPGEFISALSYSPDGRFLLVSSDYRVLVIDTVRGNKVVRLPAAVRRAYWAPDPSETRLLWIGERQAGANSPFGTVQRDGKGLTVLGAAAHFGWHPGGEGILTARVGRSTGFEFWSYETPSGKREKIADVAEMDSTVRELAFGPDGRHLVYGNKEGLFLVHLGSGRVEKILSAVGGVYSVRWIAAESQNQPGPTAR